MYKVIIEDGDQTYIFTAETLSELLIATFDAAHENAASGFTPAMYECVELGAEDAVVAAMHHDSNRIRPH